MQGAAMDGGSGTSSLRFAVLGPVRAWRGEEQLSTGSPQQRALLAALLLRRGRTATAAELVDALWGEEPPDAALAALRTYASRLRKTFGPDADTTLLSESGGYAVRLAVRALDLAIAEEYAHQAEKARSDGDRRSARELLSAALDLFEGEPLAGLPGPYAEAQRNRLAEWRLQLTESRIDLDLEAGCHAEVVSELTALTAEQPLRERLRAQLMLALYRGGRQAEALAVYADTRRLLAEELGVDPSIELRDLHQGILEADDDLAAPSDCDDGESANAVVRPAQLPATVPDFTGRTAFVGELSEQLATAEGRIMAVSAVAGIGGVGKTTLAVHVAHAARDHFPDGQLYVDLQGAGPRPAEPQAVLGSFLRALGRADAAIPDSLDERSALYRSVLDGRRVLVLLDNARDAAQVRPLLPGTEGCAALITGRARMVDLAGAHLVDLDVMSPEEALQLFTKIVGPERVAAERDAALDVVAACGFLPLAIRIAASRLASRRTWTVSVLATKLADERRRLDELQAGDLAVKATFELGYSQLEPQQARAFRLLGLADGPDISLAAATAVLALDPYEAEEVLESLVDISLLESAAPGRYRFHDLVRLYARACAERDELPPVEREAALSRLLDFYLTTTARVYAMERPGDRLPEHVATASPHGLSFSGRETALEWLFSEARCLLACAHQSTGAGVVRRGVDLLLVAKDLSESGVDPRTFEQAALTLREAARTAGDKPAEARALTALSSLYNMTGQFEEADVLGGEAALLGDSAGDPVASAHARNNHGITANYLKRYEEGEAHLQQSLELFRADDNRTSVASVLSNLSRTHLNTGRVESAVALAEQAVDIYRESGVTMRLANGKYAFGLALTQAGKLDRAHEELSDALVIFRGSRQRLWEGMTYFRLAELSLKAGKPAQAASLAEQSLAVLRTFGGSWRRANALTLLGRALNEIGQIDRARVCWQDAVAVYEELQLPEAAEVHALLQPLAPAA
ncbi:AfsR/SARP family transcriptional regulator [Streptomyces zingiberis]|uniref:Tetratricopeptide repeat protein n=1 Tax=Streptomyces zingiberis TaxID=2053010 RepID=A0ABX1BQA0_9ACTN|nr:BTAD domain-containing putative transcriptional regulator [Streptomyces zingiberis]NJP99896.1 tetratricopeptide repeat protein [Streptomyces zingiberis]